MKKEVDELDFENTESCPNCGCYVGDRTQCENCGAVLANNEEPDNFDGEEEDF